MAAATPDEVVAAVKSVVNTLVFAIARPFGDWISQMWNPLRGP